MNPLSSIGGVVPDRKATVLEKEFEEKDGEIEVTDDITDNLSRIEYTDKNMEKEHRELLEPTPITD